VQLTNLKPTQDQGIAPAAPEGRAVEKVLTFSPPRSLAAPEAPSDGHRKRDFGMALDLIEQAAMRVRAVEERSHYLETQLEALSMRAAEEVRVAEARVQAAEARAQLAEARAGEAESRADEAERWIQRLQELVERNFPR
jgi:hypothetical protein